MSIEKKPRVFWMDTDLLDKALDSCDLGDGYSAKVRQYPRKDMLSGLTHVIEKSAYDALKAENEKLKAAIKLLIEQRDLIATQVNWQYRVDLENANAAVSKILESK